MPSHIRMAGHLVKLLNFLFLFLNGRRTSPVSFTLSALSDRLGNTRNIKFKEPKGNSFCWIYIFRKESYMNYMKDDSFELLMSFYAGVVDISALKSTWRSVNK